MNTALVIIDHGSTIPASNEMLEDIAELVRAARPELRVEIAHMEVAQPFLEEAVNLLAVHPVKKIIVNPYMLAPGRHATVDIPRMVNAIADKFPGIEFVVTEPLGIHPLIAEIILERCRL